MSSFLNKKFNLSDKVALITGASSGIGAHTASTFAQAGCRVALAARREDKLEQVAKGIKSIGADVMTCAMDVTQRESVSEGVAEVVKRMERIDILINNAGTADTQPFLDMEEQAWRRVLDVDLDGVWRVGQIVANHMVAQKGGSVINMSSVLGMATQARQTNFAAAKAGVLHLTRVMALELAPHGVRVNAVAPGYFVTDLNRDFLYSARGKEYTQKLLPRRVGELHELDGAMLLLASDAGSFINGATLTIDGGAMLGGF